MKNYKIVTIVLLLIATITNSCKKTEADVKEIYTVKGRFNNYNDPTKYDGLGIRLENYSYSLLQGVKITKVAEGLISDSGRFSLQYSGGVGGGDFYMAAERLLPEIGIPPNVNYEKQYFYNDSGTVVCKLNSLSPLKNGDTLFLQFPVGLGLIKSFILPYSELIYTKTVSFRTFSNTKTNSSCMGWGKSLSTVGLNGNVYCYKVNGDPKVDTITINY